MTQDQSKAKCRRQRDNWKWRAIILETAIRKTINDNLHLADGDVCTLKDLKDALVKIEVKPLKAISARAVGSGVNFSFWNFWAAL